MSETWTCPCCGAEWEYQESGFGRLWESERYAAANPWSRNRKHCIACIRRSGTPEKKEAFLREAAEEPCRILAQELAKMHPEDVERAIGCLREHDRELYDSLVESTIQNGPEGRLEKEYLEALMEEE